MKILLITPPLLQPNTPYAATPMLAAWLKSIGHDAVQADLSLELLLKLFSREGVSALCRELEASAETERDYCETIAEVIAFLQDRNPGAARRIAARGYLPEGEHLARAYEQEERLGWNFRGLELHDRARHLASLYLDDLAASWSYVLAHPAYNEEGGDDLIAGYYRIYKCEWAVRAGLKYEEVTGDTTYRPYVDSCASYLANHNLGRTGTIGFYNLVNPPVLAWGRGIFMPMASPARIPYGSSAPGSAETE